MLADLDLLLPCLCSLLMIIFKRVMTRRGIGPWRLMGDGDNGAEGGHALLQVGP